MVLNYYQKKEKWDPLIGNFESGGKTYRLSREKTAEQGGALVLVDETGQELMRIDMKAVFDHFTTSLSGNYQTSKDSMNADEASFTIENDQAAISLIATSLAIEKTEAGTINNGDFYVLITIK